MTEITRLLILGGTTEAAVLAEKAQIQFSGRLEIIYSMAGRTKPTREFNTRVRVGGFGGSTGLADFIIKENIKFLIDATHPFAKNISANAYDACLSTETARLTLIRPPWILPPGTKYLEVDDMAHAALILTDFAKRVLVTTGQSNLDQLQKLTNVQFFVRVIEQADETAHPENYTFIYGHPPFSLEEELELMEKYSIDALLTKQSGGVATETKIIAAIRKRIPIVLIRRPLPEPGENVANYDEALKWLEQRL